MTGPPPSVATLSDPGAVREQYATEAGLVARASIYGETTGPNARDLAFEAVAEAGPRRVLEVGCGTGWFAARVQHELGADVVAVDQSERMVELACADGLDARVGDVQDLSFADAEFDCAAALWMLYHVADLDRALGELARVLRPGGRLVATTNAHDHLLELWELVGAGEARLSRHMGFSAENGADALGRHFARVDLHDAGGTVTIADRDALVRYLCSMTTWKPFAQRVPDTIPTPLVVRSSPVVFVAEK